METHVLQVEFVQYLVHVGWSISVHKCSVNTHIIEQSQNCKREKSAVTEHIQMHEDHTMCFEEAKILSSTQQEYALQ